MFVAMREERIVVKVVIIGNSSAGKSTIARGLEERYGLAHLDLDAIAWKAEAVRHPLAESVRRLEEFCAGNEAWVVEGCYAELAAAALGPGVELWWVDPGTEVCLRNARTRPWEPHKYPSREAQDANLEMLEGWIGEYEAREGELSRAAHAELFERYPGSKRQVSQASEVLIHHVHPGLAADTHSLGEARSGTVLLHRNAKVPWLILVPDVGPRDVRDLFDLAPDRRALLFEDAEAITHLLKRERGHQRVNVATLGNQVPQLHMHIIGRDRGDAVWPKPVWGFLEGERAWSESELTEWQLQIDRVLAR